MITWHSIDNLHCYHTETRPQDGSKIFVKIKFIGSGDKPYYENMICKYKESKDIVWNTETDYGGNYSFEQVVSWIYLNELTDLM